MEEIRAIACGGANAYLVCTSEGGILIDTGTTAYREKVLNACEGRPVKLILLTHGHFDHCQNAAYLAKVLGCPVGINGEDAALIQTSQKRPVKGRGLWGRIYAAASNWNIQHKRIACVDPGVILEDGMSLSAYGVDGKIIALPGHTQGSIGVLLSSGAFFVGDAMQSIVSLSAAWCFEDEDCMEKSAAVIERSGASCIYCGHGKCRGK